MTTHGNISDVELGAFTLHEPIGAGGMGTVWRGTHRRTGYPVAVKSIRVSDEGREHLVAKFEREVQLVASLHHPGIVDVLDYGTVPDDSSSDELMAGDPWLAMEFATVGSLLSVPPTRWAELRWALASVLDALAHAHARGVVHRDLKPANVLVTEVDSQRVLRLADFGIAHLRRGAARQTEEFPGTNIAGTPHFMAPEQIEGRWRDYGPWTDLYALGCVAFRLATGRYVFSGNGYVALANKHLNEPRPPLEPRFRVPPGFEAWVHRLLATDPAARFRRASDAAWVLQGLGDVEGGDVSAVSFRRDHVTHSATLTVRPEEGEDFWEGATATRVDDSGSATEETAPLPELVEPVRLSVPGAPEVISPMPADWHTPRSPQPDVTLFDVGIGLFGLRTIPLVGRREERDRIWSTLRKVRDSRTAQLIRLDGPAGVGKSRLARWACERAHEVAGAVVLRATHGRRPTARTGITAALERWTDCEGLRREEVWRRLERKLTGRCADPEALASRAAEIIRPASEGDWSGPMVHFASSTEKWMAFAELVDALAGSRMVVLWVDDGQWAARTLEAVSVMTRAPARLAAAVIVTVQTDELDARPAEKSLLQELEERSARIAVPPLDGEERIELMRTMLPLSDVAASRISERTEGYPAFAAGLLADWVDRRVLVPTDRGFEIDDERETELPVDIGALWMSRVADAITTLSDPARATDAVRAAAILGREVDMYEWLAVCAELGFAPPAGLVRILTQRGLATSHRSGWTFEHGLLREAIARSAETHDAAERIHRACARVIDEKERPGRDARMAHHFFEAGLPSRAIARGLRAVQSAWERDEAEAMAALRIVEDAARELGLEPDDPRRLQVALWRVRRHRVRWEFAQTREQAEELAVTAEQAGETRLLAEALVELGLAAGYEGGEHGRALPHFERAAELFEELGEVRRYAKVLTRMTYIRMKLGDDEDAVRLSREAVELFNRLDDDDGSLRARVALANALAANDASDDASAVFEEVVETAGGLGHRYWQANALFGLASLDERAERFGAARTRYEESARLCAEIGSTAIDAARINLACVQIVLGDVDAARVILRDIESRGTLAQLMTRARIPILTVAALSGETGKIRGLLGEISGDPPTADPTLRALVQIAAESLRDDPALANATAAALADPR